VNFIRALSIDFHILNIDMFIEADIFKSYFSQYQTAPVHYKVIH
jgi:hypothetical protein